ncbi:MAG TPA: acyl-CoA synthetase [Acidimicrobiales bacterium]|nr:acyl-CoA synthetase [Acidimicrobiales bacterium]
MTTNLKFDGGVLAGDVFTPTEELLEHAARAATGLAGLGVGPGDAVALLMRNDLPFVEASFAAAQLGAAPVPVNWHGTADEVGYILADSKAKVLVVHADLLAPLRTAVPEGVAVIGVPTPAAVAKRYDIAALCELPADVPSWSDWLQGFDPWDRELEGAPLSMIYTSGTTGRPKGVRRLPEGLDPELQAVYHEELKRFLGLEPGMRTVVTGPMYHTAPNNHALIAAQLGGFVVLQPRFDAEELLELVELHRISHLHMVPTMFVRLLKLDDAVRARYDVSSIRHVVHAAAPCPPDVKWAMIEWWGPVVHEYYGGTETGAIVGCTSEEWLAHPGTVGQPLATASVRIFDEHGNEQPPNVPGEVYVRAAGYPDFTYQGKPDARSEVERQGLVTVGDIGYLDEDGFLYLCDRKRDMVISGGVNIYPIEIEACLLKLEGVRDCAVFGIPDEEFGESLAAAVECEAGCELTVDAVKAHVREHLAGFKVPRLVTFHDELPREDSGKIFKRKLRAPYWEAAGRAI